MKDKSKMTDVVKSGSSTNSGNMKVKERIPKGVIALVCALPAMHRDIYDIYNILMEIIQFGNDVVSPDTKRYFDSETQNFDVDGIFENWAKPNPDDQSRKIAREVCSTIKKQMFEWLNIDSQ